MNRPWGEWRKSLPGTALQWWGAVPLSIFLYRWWQYLDVGTPDWIMYNCHVTMVLLSLGMIGGGRILIRVSAIWLVIGVPMWLIDAWAIQELWIASIFSHLGGCLLGLYAVRQVGVTGTSWKAATLWFLGWQLVTRWTTDPALNVNLAHSPHQLFQAWFDSYWTFWPVCALAILPLTWSVEQGLVRAMGRRGQE